MGNLAEVFYVSDQDNRDIEEQEGKGLLEVIVRVHLSIVILKLDGWSHSRTLHPICMYMYMYVSMYYSHTH